MPSHCCSHRCPPIAAAAASIAGGAGAGVGDTPGRRPLREVATGAIMMRSDGTRNVRSQTAAAGDSQGKGASSHKGELQPRLRCLACGARASTGAGVVRVALELVLCFRRRQEGDGDTAALPRLRCTC
jgi:hypothetical protein